jgi:cyclase
MLSFVLFHSLLSFDYKLQPIKISAAATHCFFGLSEVMDEHNNGNISNSCFVNMGTSYLVIDSGPSFSYASQAYSQMKKIKNLPISYVVNTHLHDDHWLGNGYYESIGAKIIGSAAFTDLPKEEMTRMQKRITKEAYLKTTQTYPSLLVEKEKNLKINSIKVSIKHVNQKAHTDSDLYVYIPSKKIVFVGDMVFNDRLPSIREGNLRGWLKGLDEIRNLDVDYIIGGHGKIITPDSVNFTYNYIKGLLQQISTLIEDGENITDVLDIVTMQEYKNMNFYDSIHRQNVEIAYRMLEWDSE